MRIAVDTKNFALHDAGISQFTKLFLRPLIEARPHDQFILVGPPCDLSFLDGLVNITKLTVPHYRRYGRAAILLYDCFQFPRAIRGLKPDLLYSPYYDFRIPRGIPTIVTIYDLCYYHYRERALIGAYYRWLAKTNATQALKIITCSNFSRDDLVRTLGVDPTKIAVVFGSIDAPSLATPNDAQAISSLKHAQGLTGSMILLYTGGITGRKNLRRLFEALSRVPEIDGIPVCLVMSNAYVHQQLLTGWAHELGIMARLILLDKVNRGVLRQWYFAADAVVYPSLWEGFGFPILEAMSAGTPIAVSAGSCLPELGGGYAEYFDPLDVQDMAEAVRRALQTGRKPVTLPAKYTLAENLARFTQALDLQGMDETRRSHISDPRREPVRL